jgi:hypothetical protein
MQSYKKNNSRSHTDPVTTTFLPKKYLVYSKFDIFLAKQKCQIRPVAYHYFSVFWRGADPYHAKYLTIIIFYKTIHGFQTPYPTMKTA